MLRATIANGSWLDLPNRRGWRPASRHSEKRQLAAIFMIKPLPIRIGAGYEG
jgi:hypothetical protein